MNTTNVFDAINHAPGVHVYSVPAPRNQLTAAQVKNCRRYSQTEGVLRRIALCRPVGLGMASTVRTLPSLIVPTKHSAPGTVRPGSRRRGHCRGPENTCFSAKMVTMAQERDREAVRWFENLKKFHLKVMLTPASQGVNMEARYERARALTLKAFPDLRQKVDAMELAHNQSVKPRKVTPKLQADRFAYEHAMAATYEQPYP